MRLKKKWHVIVVAVATMLMLVPAAGADEQYTFESPVYDIAATPAGSILVGENADGTFEVKEIRRGEVGTVIEVDAESAINGLDALGRGNFYLTTGGTDLAQNGELWRVSRGVAREVADLAAFERNNDPDALAGPQWKDQACEAIDGFSAGPQNNPFHVTALSGGTALVADAAGNTLLSATTSGVIDWRALFTPPVDSNGDWMIRWFAGDIPCYVQPVPTSVAIGPGGDLYVGELTGALSEEDGVLPIGLSRVWRIDAGANNVVCSQTDPAPDCELLIDGLTSVIDVAFGPDGLLYVVEYDANSWIAAFASGLAAGGNISAYDPDSGALVRDVASGLDFPSAITFDKRGNLWLLENNDTRVIMGDPPTVRMLP
ncbi:MAG TPA: ScyD/ScyE family protein [Acidimicrobiia bacterium]|nr:ScyD/ScyE family protein [Acidimicrobiia bacterium]